MKKNISFLYISIFYILLASTPDSIATDKFNSVDYYSTSAPSNFKNIKSAAEYLTNNNNYNQFDKVRSIYVWITSNIKYDVAAYQDHVHETDNTSNILKEKKALCEGYARLFKEMCDESGIESYIVHGYSKGFDYYQGKQFIHSDHAWNAVIINNTRYFCDLTWGSGYLQREEKTIGKILSTLIGTPSIKDKIVFNQQFNDRYFCVEPKHMVYTHLPEDPAWQLTDHILPLEIFEKDSLAINQYLSNDNKKTINYKKILEKYHSIHDTSMMLSSARRAHAFNQKNYHVLGSAHFNTAKLIIDETGHIVKESKKLLEQKYNTAIFHLEKAQHLLSLHAEETEKQYRDNLQKNKDLYKKRTRNIKSQIKRNEKIIVDNEKFIDNVSKKKKYIYKKIKKYNRENIALSFDDRIYDVRRPDELPDNADSTRIINKINDFFKNKDTIKIIQESIDSIYRVGYKGLYDTIRNYRYSLLEKINYNTHLIDINLQLIKQFEKDLIKTLDQNTVLINKNNSVSDILREEIEHKEKRGFKDKYYVINDRIRYIKSLVKENKKLLKEIKKLSFIDQDEDERYIRENDNLMEENYLIIAQFFEEFEFTKSEIPILKQEKKLLNHEIKLLRKTDKLETLRYETELELEKERYSALKEHNKLVLKEVKNMKTSCGKKKRRL